MKVQTSIVKVGEKFAAIPVGQEFLYNDSLWLRSSNGTTGKPRAVRLTDGYIQQFTGEERCVKANVNVVPS